MQPLTLFYNVSEKYQHILPINVRQHIHMCEQVIDYVYIVYANNVDPTILYSNLKNQIDKKIKIQLIHEDEVADIIGYNHTTDSRIRNDKYMLMIASKLHADILTGRDNIIVTDPDNLLLKKTSYFQDEKPIIYYSDPPFTTWKNMAKNFFNTDLDYDFMTEKMLMQAKILKPMREFMKDALLKYSYKRHTWYDISEEEYNKIKGESWPKFNSWDNLPKFVQSEIKMLILESLVKTEHYEHFADYMMYGYYAMLHYPNEIILKPTKVQNGPWGDGTADIFLNRASEKNSIDAFKYICYVNNVCN